MGRSLFNERVHLFMLTTMRSEFYCPRRRYTVTVSHCTTEFVDADAMKDRKSSCYQCPHGVRVRRHAAGM